MRFRDSSMIDGIADVDPRDWDRGREERARRAAEESARLLRPSAPPKPATGRLTEQLASRGHAGRPTPYARVQILDAGGRVVRECRGCREAADALGTTRGYVSSSLYRGIPCRGYRLRWVEPEVVAVRGGQHVRYPSVPALAKAIRVDRDRIYHSLRIGSGCQGMQIFWASEFDAKEAIAS
jgi:hypothetical protein